MNDFIDLRNTEQEEEIDLDNPAHIGHLAFYIINKAHVDGFLDTKMWAESTDLAKRINEEFRDSNNIVVLSALWYCLKVCIRETVEIQKNINMKEN